MDSKFTWESEKAQTAKESLERVVKSFLHAEQSRWVESSSPVVRTNLTTVSSCCNGSQTSNDNQCTKSDPGLKILRYCTSKILIICDVIMVGKLGKLELFKIYNVNLFFAFQQF